MNQRDEQLGAALRELEVPEHRPGFEQELRHRLEQPPARHVRRWSVALGAAAVAAAAIVLLLVGLPKSGTGPSSALAARVKARVAQRLVAGTTLSGRLVYRSSGLRGPASSRASF